MSDCIDVYCCILLKMLYFYGLIVCYSGVTTGVQWWRELS
jgi:hypothetical protein